MKYDYIIIGAGSAGCVLANRLTENGQNNVALFEAGKPSDIWKVKMPLALLYKCMIQNIIGNIIQNQNHI
tara:strand:- start:975 stop:1184 length:210 start_codon:yes stop_codon:yes gene_type:complete